MKTYILSFSGSMIVSRDAEIHMAFLRKFRTFMLQQASKGKRFVIICGGGGVNRIYNKAAKSISKVKDIDLDLLGIAATRYNAELVRAIFSDHAYKEVVVNPTKKVKTGKKIIIGCGWKPGCSTDKDAVLAAKTFGANAIINLTNVDYVYTKDPRKFKDAKKIEKISWKNFRKIVGNKWSPKLDTPFDPIAAKIAQKMKLKVMIANGKNLNNLKRILEGKNFKGTLVY